MKLTVKQVADILNGTIVGDPNLVIEGVSGIKEARPGDLTFIANRKYLALLKSTQASAVIVSSDIANGSEATLIQVENPSIAFATIMNHVGPDPIRVPPGIHPTAIIGRHVRLGREVSVQPHAVIEDHAEIGDRTVVGAGCYIGHYTTIGSDGLLWPHVVVRDRITVGNKVIVHSGTCIGGDGFGFATVKGVHHKIPQIGTVVIGNDVEIGSNVTIDRARFNTTYIGNGVKIDNLVQIAHNVYIGDNTIVVAQVGISGSTIIGKNVVIAGQAGIIGHVAVGDNAVIGGKAGVTKDIAPNTVVTGFPAREKWEDMRFQAYLRRQPELLERIKQLEARIQELEERVHPANETAKKHRR